MGILFLYELWPAEDIGVSVRQERPFSHWRRKVLSGHKKVLRAQMRTDAGLYGISLLRGQEAETGLPAQ